MILQKHCFLHRIEKGLLIQKGLNNDSWHEDCTKTMSLKRFFVHLVSLTDGKYTLPVVVFQIKAIWMVSPLIMMGVTEGEETAFTDLYYSLMPQTNFSNLWNLLLYCNILVLKCVLKSLPITKFIYFLNFLQKIIN